MTESEWNNSTNPAAMLKWLRLGNVAADDDYPPNYSHCPIRVSDRKLRLFACACCRQVWHLLTDPRSRKAVEVADRFADGMATEKERNKLWNSIDFESGHDAYWILVYAAISQHPSRTMTKSQTAIEKVVSPQLQAALLRQIAGNPWRPITICPSHYEDRAGSRLHIFECPDPDKGYHAPHCLLSNQTVRVIAKSAYEERKTHVETGELDPNTLGILADCLEDAGCEDERILKSLRGEDVCGDCEGKGWVWIDNGGNVGQGHCIACNDTGWVKATMPRYRGFHTLDLILGKE
jgi:hypothetical protein